jgi:hypothetical protein
MPNFEFFKITMGLNLRRPYFIYATLFGLTSLILPLGAQFLVNNLALSGIWVNVISFIVLIALGLILSTSLKHYLLILKEYLQRELFVLEVTKWTLDVQGRGNKYFLEAVMLLKAYAYVFTNFVEIGLIVTFGLITITVFHPAFFILPILFVFTFYFISRLTNSAVKTSIIESDKKYEMFDLVLNNHAIDEKSLNTYLEARNNHFNFIKSISFKISLLNIFCHVLLLSGGIFLIELNQLSIGQLIASEIILTGVLVSLDKLPGTLESFYDFETNMYKLKKAFKEKTHD